MNGNETMFGVNFADGRIKGYPSGKVGGAAKKFYVLYVRGNENYGINDLEDMGDGTIVDHATGLMWQKNDSGEGLNWEEALAWVQTQNSGNYLGYNDWRLPNVKELQSIVDYTRAPAITNSPAIDPMFTSSDIQDEGGGTNYPFYWSGTTHASLSNGKSASYVAFGEGLGFMANQSDEYVLMDVHGAGCQRSDPKSGDPEDYPYGHGPQGDVIRIYNYVRMVRDTTITPDKINDQDMDGSGELKLENYPNPFNESTTIKYSIQEEGNYQLFIYDINGNIVDSLDLGELSSGVHYEFYKNDGLNTGVYYCKLSGNGIIAYTTLLIY